MASHHSRNPIAKADFLNDSDALRPEVIERVQDAWRQAVAGKRFSREDYIVFLETHAGVLNDAEIDELVYWDEWEGVAHG